MAERLRPPKAWYVRVQLSQENWLHLSAYIKVAISEDDRISIQECINRYTQDLYSHDQALPRAKIASEFKRMVKIFNSTAKKLETMSRWTDLNNLENGKIIDTVTLIFQKECWELYGIDLDLWYVVTLLKDLEEIAISSKKYVMNDGFHNSGLDIFLDALADNFHRISKRGRTSKACLSFIHEVCAILFIQLGEHSPDTKFLNTLGSVVTATHKDSDDQARRAVITRIQNRGRFKKIRAESANFNLMKQAPKRRERVPRS